MTTTKSEGRPVYLGHSRTSSKSGGAGQRVRSEVLEVSVEKRKCSLFFVGDRRHRGLESRRGHKVAPNKAPTPAVKAIASAPQKVMRAMERQTGEPPARAAEKPNNARNTKEPPETVQTKADRGTTITRSGRAAPTAKVPCRSEGSLHRSRAQRVGNAQLIVGVRH